MKLLILIFLITAAPLCAQSSADLVVTLRRDATVTAGFVTLADVAELEGRQTDRAAGVMLGRAPAPGEARSIDHAYVRARLQQSGIDTSTVAIYGFERPLLFGEGRHWRDDDDAGRNTKPRTARPAQAPEPETAVRPVQNPESEGEAPAASADDLVADALERIRRLIESQLGRTEGTLIVTEVSRSRSLQRLEGTGLQLTDVQSRHRAVALGRLDFELTAHAGREVVRGLTLTVRAELEVKRAVSTREFRRGDRVDDGAIEMRAIRTTSLAEPGFTTLADASGLEATRALSAGDTLTAQNTQPAVLIRRGDLVRVQATLPGGGRVTVMAEAQEAGAKGETIRLRRRVEGTRDNVDLVATVTGEGSAEAQ